MRSEAALLENLVIPKNKSLRSSGPLWRFLNRNLKPVQKKQIGEKLVKNPNIQLQADNWVLQRKRQRRCNYTNMKVSLPRPDRLLTNM